MTTLDEQVLRDAVTAAGDAIEVPTDGIARVLDAARTKASEPPARLQLVPKRRATRVALGVAAVMVMVVGVAGPLAALGRSQPGPTRSAFNGPEFAGNKSLQGSYAYGTAGLPLHSTSTEANGPLVVAPGATTHGKTTTLVVAVGTVDLATGDASIRADLATLSAYAVRDGGFVASTNAKIGSTATSSAMIVLRVPEAKYADLLGQVERTGRATSVVTNADDVTAQFVDYQARIASLELSRRQYLVIMSKATSIGDILAVQSQINQLQTQIEQLEGQRNLLRNQAAYGTLTVALSPTGRVITTAPAGSGLVGAIHGSVGGFVAAFEGLVRLLGPALFALLCLAVALVLGRLVWRATRRRML